jgi:hypothetical protein
MPEMPEEAHEILYGNSEREGLVHVTRRLTDWSGKVDKIIFGSHAAPGLLAHVERHNRLEEKIGRWLPKLWGGLLVFLITWVVGLLAFLGKFIFDQVAGG